MDQERLRQLRQLPDDAVPGPWKPEVENARALALVALSLSPENENVKCGDLCASINDLRQIAMSATEEMERLTILVRHLSRSL
jgi:hypothetical protein